MCLNECLNSRRVRGEQERKSGRDESVCAALFWSRKLKVFLNAVQTPADTALPAACACAASLNVGLSIYLLLLLQVKFDIDANGILSVTATDKGTGKKQDIKITGASVLPKVRVAGAAGAGVVAAACVCAVSCCVRLVFGSRTAM